MLIPRGRNQPGGCVVGWGGRLGDGGGGFAGRRQGMKGGAG